MDQQRHLTIALDPMKAFLGFQQDGAGPAPGHVRIPPAFDVVAQIASQREAALNDIRTGQETTKLGRQLQTVHGQRLVEPFLQPPPG